MSWSYILNIVAVIVAPIIAVWVGQKLQDRQDKRKDKLELFKVLMTSRMGWTPESVQAMNILDIVFSDDKKVRAAWKAYYDRLCTDDPQNPTQQELKHIQEAQYELLETMANSLGYKDKITWKTIQNPYKPVGMGELEQNQRKYQEGQLALADIALALKNGQFPNASNPVTRKDK